MADDEKGRSLLESLRMLQDGVNRAGPAATAAYSLIGAVVLLGAAGYAVDRWLGTAPWGLVSGLLFGVATGLYLLAREVWPR